LLLLAHHTGTIGYLAVMFLHHLKVGAPVVQQELLMPKGKLLFQDIHCIDDCVCICAGAELIFWN
jgi:hypothetical protein